MEWLLFTVIFFIVVVAFIAGLIVYKKNKELDIKFAKLQEQQKRPEPSWLS